MLLGNVLVALQDLPAGTALAAGAPARMYGVRVGQATQPIALGEVLTTANVRQETEAYDLDRRQA